MTQVTNYAVANGPRATVRQDFNAVLAALRDDNAGLTAPPNAVPGMWWRDTSVSPSQLRLRNDTNTAWLPFNAPTLAALDITATPAQINPLDGGRATGNSVLLRENINLAAVAEDFSSPLWLSTSPVAGMSRQKTVGFDALGPFVDYRIFGNTPPGNTQSDFLFGAPSQPAVNGQTYTASMVVERIAGGWGGVINIAVGCVAWDTNGAYVTETAGSANASLVGAAVIQAVMPLNAPNRQRVSPSAFAVLQPSSAIDITFRIRGLQLDLGATRRAYRYLPATPAQARAALGVPFISRAGRSAAGLTAVEFNDLPVGEVYNFQMNGVSLATGGNLLIQFGTAAGWIATGYNTSSHLIVNTQSNSATWATNGIVAALGGASLAANGLVTVTRQGDNMGVNGGVDLTVGSAQVRNATCFGGVALATGAVITRARVIATDGGAFDAGTISLMIA